jgi:apolipoprotein D and lipocalin family protein
MRRRKIIEAFIYSLSALFAFSGCPKNPPATVSLVDLDRYLGKWFQIAAYEVFFNRDLVGVTAEYSLNDDGSIRVFNRGLKGSLQGDEETIEGVARVVDEQTKSKLSVQFNFPLGRLFKGEYWIVDLDTQDYAYAVVSDSRRSTLFILSRTPQMDQEVYNGIIDRLNNNGFDTSRLVLTEQPPAT